MLVHGFPDKRLCIKPNALCRKSITKVVLNVVSFQTWAKLLGWNWEQFCLYGVFSFNGRRGANLGKTYKCTKEDMAVRGGSKLDPVLAECNSFGLCRLWNGKGL